MKTKTEIKALFDGFFSGQKTIYDYFGAEDFPTYDYELQFNEANWLVRDDTYHYQIPEGEEEGTYSGRITDIYRKDYYTLIFASSQMGGAGFAFIFDNNKEIKA